MGEANEDERAHEEAEHDEGETEAENGKAEAEPEDTEHEDTEHEEEMEHEREVERAVTRDEAATVFRDLADGIDDGCARVGESEPLQASVPDTVELELELEVEPDEAELEVELEWPRHGGDHLVGSGEE